MLMRHAKSDWDAGATDDHSRPLNKRGKRSAERMGEVVRDLGLVPDLVVSSTATRARSTAELARLSGGWASRLILEDGLYGAGVEETLSVAASHGDGSTRLMLVGHQPTWSMLVHQLSGSSADMKTACVAEIALTLESWAELPFSAGDLTALHNPRLHFGSEWDVQGSGI